MKGIPSGVEIPSYRPLNDQIMVYLEPDADRYSAAPSLVKPESAKADHVFRIGRVVKVGPGAWHHKKPIRLPIGVEPGERVMFVKFVATHTKTAESIQHSLGKDFALLRSNDLLFAVDEDFSMDSISQ